MTKYIIQRILVSIPVFLGITLFVYALYSLSPGDPVINLIGGDQYQRDVRQSRYSRSASSMVSTSHGPSAM